MATPPMVLHLGEPAPRAARVIARELLANVRAAWRRLGADDKALHDLRVALRRLRSWLRAWDSVLEDTLRRRTRRALSDLAGATNAPRDAEVALAWVRSERDLPPECRAGRAALIRQLKEDCARTTREAAGDLAKRLPGVMRELDAELSHYWLRVPMDEQLAEPVMAWATADLVTRHARRLRRSLARVGSRADVDAAHRTRIAGKRLRYLLEPFAYDRATVRMIDRLRTLQDRLGEFHDAQLLAGRIEKFRAAAESRPALWPGLDALAARVRSLEGQSFARFRRAWGTRGAGTAFEAIRAIASGIRAQTTGPASSGRSAP